VACLPRDLPEFIAVDLSKMETGTTLHANDLVVPEGVKMVTDSVIASVIQPVEEEIIAPAAAAGGGCPRSPASRPGQVIRQDTFARCWSFQGSSRYGASPRGF